MLQDDGLQQHEMRTTSPTPMQRLDWSALRELSLQPGGFGATRVEKWAQILNVPTVQDGQVPFELQKGLDSKKEKLEMEDGSVSDGGPSPHRDERQIRLDTDRSFVLYPVDGTKHREHLQGQLHDLIVSLFRKRPRLSYFQGYHDIISVLFLTLPEELQLACAEKLSLHRLRDSMGSGLEPVLGLLRVLHRVLSEADPDYVNLLDRNAQLPYYALSNLLTLFSHDMPTLPLIQHVFDYLLCRPPITAVYLAAAVVLSRKEEAARLEEEGEEGMIHSLLSSLPDLYEEDEDVMNGIPLSEHPDAPPPGKAEVLAAEEPLPETETETDKAITRETPPEATANGISILIKSSEEEMKTSLLQAVSDERVFSEQLQDAAPPIEGGTECAEAEGIPMQDEEQSELARSPELLPPLSETAISSSVPSIRSASLTPEELPSRSSTPPTNAMPQRPRISITSLLRVADALYEQYPPTLPAIDLPSIMGPQSVMLTWSEHPADLPDDDEAELMVTQPHLVVLPHVETSVHTKESDEDDDYSHSEKEKEKRKRRRLQKPRRLTTMVMQRKAVVASAVLVLGVAMAVYGLQSAPGTFRGLGYDGHRGSRDWRRLGKFFGGVLLGAGERLFDGFLR